MGGSCVLHERHRARSARVEWFAILGLVVLGGALRFFELGHLPPGLYHDEAFNGLDALKVLRGCAPLFFEANNGREPLFIYLIALSVAVLGRTPGAIRIVSAFLGTITVPVTYAMAREMFGRRIAIWAALVVAITVWPINLSRVGFRAVSLPLFAGLAVWWMWRGLRSRRGIDFALGGLCFGLLFYTYLAARVALVAMSVYALYVIVRHRESVPWKGVILFVVVALLVALPLGIYLLGHWEAMLSRGGQVAITNPAINGGDFWGTLARHLVRGTLAFTHRGDFIPRHNVPLRPVFDPILAVAFVAGIAISVARAARGKQEYVFLLIWVVVMWLPTVLAEDAPHFLRGVGVLPLLCVIPSVALEAGERIIAGRVSRGVALATAVVVVALGLGGTCVDYFRRHARSEAAYYQFETGAVEMSAEINSFLGIGWSGKELGARSTALLPQRRVYLAERLWKDWASVRYLVPESDGLTILPTDGGVPSGVGSSGDVMLALWPFERPAEQIGLLPADSVISVREGAMERGDLEEEARLLYVVYLGQRDRPVTRNLNCEFESGISLLGSEVSPSGSEGVRVRLIWQATEPLGVSYTVFVHVTHDGQMVASGDSLPAGGYYLTSQWRAGDIIVDDHSISLPEPFDSREHRIVVGLYELQTLERLALLDEAGHVIGDHVEIPVATGKGGS